MRKLIVIPLLWVQIACKAIINSAGSCRKTLGLWSVFTALLLWYHRQVVVILQLEAITIVGHISLGIDNFIQKLATVIRRSFVIIENAHDLYTYQYPLW